MAKSIKEIVKEALEELISDNAIVIEDESGEKIEDLNLNVVHSDEDDNEDIESDEDSDNDEE